MMTMKKKEGEGEAGEDLEEGEGEGLEEAGEDMEEILVS